MRPTSWMFFALGLATAGCTRAEEDLPLLTLRAPEGFRVQLYARVPEARSLALGARGSVFVGTREAGRVYALADADGDGRAEEIRVVASGLDMPNGVAYRDGALYVAEIGRILRLERIEERLADPPDPVVVTDTFPEDRHHGWKFIAVGPDGMLYVPVGAPCNVCLRERGIYASITRMRPDGSHLEIFARGVRNTVGFDWHPETGILWFTDNGRDWLGDDLPPDELNRAPRPGLHFGFPFLHGKDVLDPEFGARKPERLAIAPPALELGPHVAALGMRFYTGRMFPEEYRGQIFVAEHGSWNRSRKIGYRVMLVRLEGDEAVAYEPFLTGWLRADERVWGRPVDLLVLNDGSLLVSDDYAGAIYRVVYTGG